MTRVCLLGSEDCNLQYELLSRETARDALATYDIREPFDNAVGIETVSLGAAVALLNDLDWYLVRFADEAMVFEPSVSDDEWLSRALATAIRDDDVTPEESARFLKVYGVERPGSGPQGGSAEGGTVSTGEDRGEGPAMDDTEPSESGPAERPPGGDSSGDRDGVESDRPPRLVEPMFVTRTGDDLPAYDLRDVEDTLVERVTESEFGA